MRARTEPPVGSGAARRLRLALAASMAVACASPGPVRPVQVESQDANGFTITEEVRVGAGVHADFEEALALLEQGRHEAGIALLTEVIERAPHVTAAHIDLAIAYGRVNDLERAEASLVRALELNPRHPVALNELGIVYRKTGRFQEARRSYEAALAAYPGFRFARLNLAILCDVYLADTSCALEHYQRYAEAAPEDETVPMWVADLLARSGR